PQLLGADGTDGISGLGAWTNEKWYAGNVQVCSVKGMRLPTVYETTVTENDVNYPTSDGLPMFAQTTGIPSNGWTWTASIYGTSVARCRMWLGQDSNKGELPFGSGRIRCVLP